MTLPRGGPRPDGRDESVVSYHHVIHALRRKPMALLGLVNRDQLFPFEAYRQTFEALLAAGSEQNACRHRGAARPRSRPKLQGRTRCVPRRGLRAGRLPGVADLLTRFAPDPVSVPHVTISLVSLKCYESLLGGAVTGEVV